MASAIQSSVAGVNVHSSSPRGTIQAGKIADLVVLERNPLEDITNTRRISAVVVRGRLLSHADLDAALKDVAARAPKQ
jgi:predicted amidohydrolase YtcJ